jgi:hypothetical protein
MKGRGGKSQERARQKKHHQKETSEKKMQAREKLEISCNIAFFQRFVAPEGRKVDSVKWWVRSQLGR